MEKSTGEMGYAEKLTSWAKNLFFRPNPHKRTASWSKHKANKKYKARALRKKVRKDKAKLRARSKAKRNKK